MDISSQNWCLDPRIVQNQIKDNCEKRGDTLIHTPSGKRVAALMPVYTLGNIPDMDAFHSIAADYRIPLIVDAACAVGAEYHGKQFGALADLSILSFNGNKTVTCGGGGAIVGNNKELMEKVKHLTTTARVWPDYDFDMIGFNYRMTNIQAAVGCAQLERLGQFIKSKKRIRRYYAEALENVAELSFFPSTEGSSCWFSGIVLPEGAAYAAKNICARLKEAEIEARPFWKPVHLQRPYASVPQSRLNVTEKLWGRIVTLPCSTNITLDELTIVVQKVKQILNEFL